MIRAIRRLFSPPSPAPRPRSAAASCPLQSAASAAPVTPVRHSFEALNTVDHRTPIPPMGIYVHRLLSKFNRLQLASVARYLWDNVGMVFYATDLVANYSTPMMPRAATLDRRWNESANSLFEDWAGRADFTGRFDFWDLQRLSSFYLDTKGRVLGYWLDGKSLLPANVLVHLFDLERYTHYRGISPFRRGANDMRDGNDIRGFQKVLSKLSTALTRLLQFEGLRDDISALFRGFLAIAPA